MSATLGLIDSTTFSSAGFYNRNNRRRIFHDYPTGMFPLTGLLSLMEEDYTDHHEFGWWEKRFEEPETTVKAVVAPFLDSSGNDTLGDEVDFVVGTEYRVVVADATQFQARQVIWMVDLHQTGGALVSLKGVVTAAVDTTNDYIQFRALEATQNVTNTNTASPSGPVGCQVIVIGNANAEGAASTTGRFYPPIRLTNYTQIFRNAFSFTRTSLKEPVDFDKTGLYREKAEDNLRMHMTGMEKAFLFGVKDEQTVTIDSEDLPERTTGGVYWFLQEWNKADSGYRGGSGAPAATTTNELLRIIRSSSGTVNWSAWIQYLEWAFRSTNDRAMEKVFMCGSGFLAAVNTALETKATLYKRFEPQKIYGLDVVTWVTPFGTVHFKTHPLFTKQSALRYNGLLLDVQNLRYRPLNDSDTTVLPNRQNNDEDRRKDEWLTEAGLECRFPESHMAIEDMQELDPAN